jgi:hypothetical protein
VDDVKLLGAIEMEGMLVVGRGEMVGLKDGGPVVGYGVVVGDPVGSPGRYVE